MSDKPSFFAQLKRENFVHRLRNDRPYAESNIRSYR